MYTELNLSSEPSSVAEKNNELLVKVKGWIAGVEEMVGGRGLKEE